MIVFRRTLGVALGLLLLPVYLLAMVSCQIGATVLSADFYKDRFSDSKLYDFVLMELPLALVGEIRRSGDRSRELDEVVLMSYGLTDQEIVDSLNRALPPALLQQTLEQGLDEIVPYIAGERGGFILIVDLNEIGEALVEETKYILRESDAYTSLSEMVGRIVAEEVASGTEELNLGVSTERIAQAVMDTVTADWLRAQIESSLDELAPYLLGETDAFEVSLNVGELAERGASEAKDLLREAGAYDTLYEDVLETAIADRLDVDLLTPSGVEVVREELLGVIKVAAPEAWIREHVERLVDEGADWISGTSQEMSVVIDLRENKVAAHSALLDLTRRKVEEYLTDCPENLVALADVLIRARLQECRALSGATGPEIDEAVSLLKKHLDPEIETHVLANIPDSIHITDQDILWGDVDISEGHFASILEDVREITLRAQSFTEADLREELERISGPWTVDALKQVRSALSGGLVWTEQDLLSLVESELGHGELQDFQQARTWMSRFKALSWLAWIPVIVLLISIGLLGGRNWHSRVSWAAACLIGITSLLVVALQFLHSMWSSRIEEVRVETLGQLDPGSPSSLSTEMIVNKGFDVVTGAGSVFIDGLVRQSLIGLAIGLAVVAATIVWWHWRTT